MKHSIAQALTKIKRQTAMLASVFKFSPASGITPARMPVVAQPATRAILVVAHGREFVLEVSNG